MTARHHHALRTPDIVGGSYRDVGEHSLALEQVIFVAVAKVTRHRRIQSDAVLPLFVNQALTSRKAIFWPSKADLEQKAVGNQPVVLPGTCTRMLRAAGKYVETAYCEVLRAPKGQTRAKER